MNGWKTGIMCTLRELKRQSPRILINLIITECSKTHKNWMLGLC
jgi:hypothetical protein